MSKKQKFEDDEQMKINHSTPAIQNEDHVSCAKVTLPKTTLLDLPMELQEHILLETIVSEVRDRKLLRGAWKEAGDRVAERLRNVCPQWDYALTTEYFRNRLHGILDSFPQVELCFKILVNHRFTSCFNVTALNDEVYVLRRPPQQHYCIEVYARVDLQTVKRTIQLPAGVTIPWTFVACSVKNCLYILHQNLISNSVEIWRVLIDEHEFQISTWITGTTQNLSRMSISADGSLILFQGPRPSTIKVYNGDGSLQHQMELVNIIYHHIENILAKSNGNFVLVKMEGLTEVDREGNTLYEYNEPSHIFCAIDLCDRIVMIDDGGYVRLLDSDFNSAKVKLELESNCKGCNKLFYRVHYHRKRNEFVAFENAAFSRAGARQSLTIFNYTERSLPNVEHSE